MTDSGARVEAWDEADGPLSEKRLILILEQEGFEVGIFTYREGTSFPEHEHAQEKCDAILEGFFRVIIGGETFDLKPGERLYIPARTPHSAEVIGRRTVLSLDGTRW